MARTNIEKMHKPQCLPLQPLLQEIQELENLQKKSMVSRQSTLVRFVAKGLQAIHCAVSLLDVTNRKSWKFQNYRRPEETGKHNKLWIQSIIWRKGAGEERQQAKQDNVSSEEKVKPVADADVNGNREQKSNLIKKTKMQT